MIPLTIGTWNVRKLIDRDGSDIPQCRTGLVGIELGKYLEERDCCRE